MVSLTPDSNPNPDAFKQEKFLSEARRTDAPFPKPYFEDTMMDSMGIDDREETMGPGEDKQPVLAQKSKSAIPKQHDTYEMSRTMQDKFD